MATAIMDRETVIKAMADIGRASGLEAAAKVILALADHKRRVVGTSELRAAAASLIECAADIRAKAKSTIGMNGKLKE